MGAAITIIRLFFLIMSGIFGLYGFVLALAILIIHLYNLTSFGVPQLKSYEKFEFQDIKDILIRGPWYKMIKRPDIAKDKIRMKTNNE
jgi:spore germination protein KA